MLNEIDLQIYSFSYGALRLFARIPITSEYLFVIQFVVLFCVLNKNTLKNHQNNNFSFNYSNSDFVCAASYLNQYVHCAVCTHSMRFNLFFFSVLYEKHLFHHCSFLYIIFLPFRTFRCDAVYFAAFAHAKSQNAHSGTCIFSEYNFRKK